MESLPNNVNNCSIEIKNNNSLEELNEFIKQLDSINIEFSIDEQTSNLKKFLLKFHSMNKYIINYSSEISKNFSHCNANIIEPLNLQNKDFIAVLYHFPCFDGAYSAINAFIYYNFLCESKRQKQVEFFPMTNLQSLQEILELDYFQRFKKIFIFDKGFNSEDFEYLLEYLNYYISISGNIKQKIYVIDHHISSIKIFIDDYLTKYQEFKNIIFFVFDKEEKRSACGLTYDFFYNKALRKIKSCFTNKSKNIDKLYLEFVNSQEGKLNDNILNEQYLKFVKYFSQDYKQIIDYVEDTDTGNYMLKHTNEFKSGLSNYVFPLKVKCNFTGKANIKNIQTLIDVNVSFCIKSGMKAYATYKQKAANEVSKDNVFLVKLAKPGMPPVCGKINKIDDNLKEAFWLFLACYSNNESLRNQGAVLLSEVSEIRGYDPIGAFIYQKEKNVYKISMRTHSENIDLGVICGYFSGGGHKKSSSFSEDYDFVNAMKITKTNIAKEIHLLQNSRK